MQKKSNSRPIDHDCFVCLDCETTGLDPEVDSIIELAVAKFDSKEIFAQMEHLIDPECDIPATSIKIHHITPEMVKDKPKIAEVLQTYLDFIGNSTIVGHGVEFDMKLLAKAAERLNIPCTIMTNPSIDTVRMGRLYGESPSNSLEMLRQHFNIEEEGAHRAMNDVMVNINVFRFLSKFHKSSKELITLLKKPIMLKYMPLGPHKGRLIKDVPLEFLRWSANKNFDEDFLFTVRSELKRRKEGVQFGQSGNPFLTLE